MRTNVRHIYAFTKHPPEEQEYNCKLYIKSDCKFNPASLTIEQALDDCKSAIKSNQLANNHCRKPQHNLTLNQHTLLLHLGNNNDILIVIPADKNLDTVFFQRVVCIKYACQQNFGNVRNY